MTLAQLVDHCATVAERQLLAGGHCNTLFAAADPTGKVTVLVLDEFSSDRLRHLNMLRVFCGVFPVDCYAVSFEAWAAEIPREAGNFKPSDSADKVETLAIVGADATERRAVVREIKRAPLGLGPPESVDGANGDLFHLLPPAPLPPESKAVLRLLWDTRYKATMSDAWIDPVVERN